MGFLKKFLIFQKFLLEFSEFSRDFKNCFGFQWISNKDILEFRGISRDFTKLHVILRISKNFQKIFYVHSTDIPYIYVITSM